MTVSLELSTILVAVFVVSAMAMYSPSAELVFNSFWRRANRDIREPLKVITHTDVDLL